METTYELAIEALGSPRLITEAEMEEVAGGVIPVAVIWGAVALGAALGAALAVYLES